MQKSVTLELVFQPTCSLWWQWYLIHGWYCKQWSWEMTEKQHCRIVWHLPTLQYRAYTIQEVCTVCMHSLYVQFVCAVCMCSLYVQFVCAVCMSSFNQRFWWSFKPCFSSSRAAYYRFVTNTSSKPRRSTEFLTIPVAPLTDVAIHWWNPHLWGETWPIIIHKLTIFAVWPNRESTSICGNSVTLKFW